MIVDVHGYLCVYGCLFVFVHVCVYNSYQHVDIYGLCPHLWAVVHTCGCLCSFMWIFVLVCVCLRIFVGVVII